MTETEHDGTCYQCNFDIRWRDGKVKAEDLGLQRSMEKKEGKRGPVQEIGGLKVCWREYVPTKNCWQTIF